MQEIIFYKFSNDKEWKIITEMLRSKNIQWTEVDGYIKLRSFIYNVKPETLSKEQFISLYIKFLKSSVESGFSNILIHENTFKLIKSKLKTLDIQPIIVTINYLFIKL